MLTSANFDQYPDPHSDVNELRKGWTMCVPSFIAIAQLDQILERGMIRPPPGCGKSKLPGLDRVKEQIRYCMES